MKNRNGLIAIGVIAVLAIIYAIIQSGNLSQTQLQLSTLHSAATTQAQSLASQGTADVATLIAANTLAADNQQQAVIDAANSAATAQAKAVTSGANAAATTQANALSDAAKAAGTAQADRANVAATTQAQALSDAANAAATTQANALSDAAKAAATAQAQALGQAANSASTLQAQVLAAASEAAATAQADALKNAANSAATTQAKAVEDAKNAAATQQAQIVSTQQAGSTATLGAVVNAGATTQAEALASAQNSDATAQAQAVMIAQAEASATMNGIIMQSAMDADATQTKLQATQAAVNTQIAQINTQLTAQAPTSTLPVVGEATAEATPQPIPTDWKRFVGKGVAIQLPKTYIGSELGTDPQSLSKLLRSLGPDFAAAATLLDSNPDILSFIAVNTGDGDKNLAANVIILSIPLPSAVPMTTLLDATISQLPSGSKVIEKGVVPFGQYQAGRMVIETHVGGLVSTQLQYYIITNNTLYLVGFTGAPNNFDAQLPLFEQSAKTFEILAAPGA